jgi:hypothetical protein
MKNLINMKTTALLLTWALIFFPLFAFSQMTINAGENQHLCNPDWSNEVILIGGNPTVTGGVSPLTYAWYIEPYEAFFPGSGIILYASDMLDDTTIANPRVIDIFTENDLNTQYFKLTVTDNVGTTLTDSVQITSSNFFHHLGYVGHNINQGDSVFLDKESNVGAGIGSLSYLWQPSHGLSDTVLYTDFWTKPDSTIAYYVTVTDSMGCQRTGSPLYYITVNSLSTNEIMANSSFDIYPNPANRFIIIETNSFSSSYVATITDITGKIVLTTMIDNNKNTINVEKLDVGVYFINISKNQQYLYSKKWIKE